LPVSRLISLFCLSIVPSFLTFALSATSPSPIATLTSSGSSIEWSVQVTGHDRIRLTVLAPDGESIVREFAAGSTPLLKLSDLGDAPLAGQYNYELRVLPKIASDAKARLAEMRERGETPTTERALLDRTAALVQAGTFAIADGAVVAAGHAEPGVASTADRNWQVGALDQVIDDDFIVRGSLCAGLDCADGESFGFETLRLKENNLAIHFDDTSETAGFANNDWRILANEDGAGGAAKFAIEDSTASRELLTIEAGAPASALYVDSSGNVGLQTTTPAMDLHVVDDDTPAIRLEQTAAASFVPYRWDLGGHESFFFVRDVDGGSRLPFRVYPGAPTSSLNVAGSGFIGLGTNAPRSRLHVTRSEVPAFPTPIAAADLLVLEANDHTNFSMVSAPGKLSTIRFFRSGATALNGFLRYDHAVDSMLLGVAGATRVTVTGAAMGVGNLAPAHPFVVGTPGNASNGNGAHVTAGGTWTNGSSRAFKTGIEELDAEDAREAVAALKPVRYHYKAEPAEEYVGFIAEDVPELVAQTSTERKYLSPMDIVAALTKVVQEQQKTIEELSRKVEALEQNR
jgi:hypothetical protein